MLDPRYEQPVRIYEAKGGEEGTSTCDRTKLSKNILCLGNHRKLV